MIVIDAAGPTREQRVRYRQAVQYLAGHEVDKLLRTRTRTGGIKARTGRQHNGSSIVERDEVFEVAACHRCFPGHHHHSSSLLE